MNNPAPVRQRLDKWLWFARVVKTRTLAARLVLGGYVRVNGVKIDTPAKPVGSPDILTVSLDRHVRILRVLRPGERRGSFPEASLLFEDLTPPAPDAQLERVQEEMREAGSGRPTKRDRRETIRLKLPEY